MLRHNVSPALAALAAGMLLALAPPASAQDAAPSPATDEAANAPKVTINEYIVRGNSVLDARSIEKAVTPYLGPGRTMADVEAARGALQAVYQAQGYQSVYVDLPEQQVVGGVVFLQVSETRIGNVEVVGARHSDPDRLRARVPALQAGAVPDFEQAQRQLTELNRNAKRQVIPLVQPGKQGESMDVQLKVEDKSPWRFGASVNNDHSPDTTSLRSVLTVGHDNLWQRDHVASLTFFAAPEDLDEANVWSGSYLMPLGSPAWTLEFSGYNSDSNVLTEGNTNVTGRGHAFGLKLARTLAVTGPWWHQLSLGVDFKDLDERVSMAGEQAQYVPLRYAPITAGYSGWRQGEHHQVGAALQLVFGTRSLLGYGSSEDDFDWKRYGADPSFVLLKADLNDTLTLDGGAQWYLRLSTQVTDTPLVSGEQFAAGGMYTVRGYRSAEALGDYGALGTVEWRTAPLGVWGLQDWRVYAYLDGAWLKLRDPLPEQDDEFSLGSAGLGTSFRIHDLLNVRLDYGYPLLDGPTTTKGAHRLHFSVGTSF